MPLGQVASRFKEGVWLSSVMFFAARHRAIFLYMSNEFTSYDNLMVDK